MKKPTSSHLVKKIARENQKINQRSIKKNKKKKQVSVIKVWDQTKIIKESRKKTESKKTKKEKKIEEKADKKF